MIVGYARVSTDGQNYATQHAALIAAGCAKVFAEKVSGAKTDRAQLAKAIAALTDGDCLIVTKLDRLARSTRDLLNTLAEITQRGASFKSLGDNWADTTTPHGRLMLTVLGGLAEFERHLILARTSEGRQRAQQRGVRFGRRPKLTAHQQQEALARRASGEALVDIARSYAVSHSTISRLAGCEGGLTDSPTAVSPNHQPPRSKRDQRLTAILFLRNEVGQTEPLRLAQRLALPRPGRLHHDDDPIVATSIIDED